MDKNANADVCGLYSFIGRMRVQNQTQMKQNPKTSALGWWYGPSKMMGGKMQLCE